MGTLALFVDWKQTYGRHKFTHENMLITIDNDGERLEKIWITTLENKVCTIAQIISVLSELKLDLSKVRPTSNSEFLVSA